MKSRANWWAQIDRTRAKRKIGDKAASLYGWHSLRATFVVLAYEAGVPLADVQKVVGHSTVEMTLQYYNPDKKLVAERVRQREANIVGEVSVQISTAEDELRPACECYPCAGVGRI